MAAFVLAKAGRAFAECPTDLPEIAQETVEFEIRIQLSGGVSPL